MIQRARAAMRRQAHEAYRLSVTRGLKIPGFVVASEGYILACDYHDPRTGKIYIATVYIRDDGRIMRIKEHNDAQA